MSVKIEVEICKHDLVKFLCPLCHPPIEEVKKVYEEAGLRIGKMIAEQLHNILIDVLTGKSD